jgi:hypothetical protein
VRFTCRTSGALDVAAGRAIVPHADGRGYM